MHGSLQKCCCNKMLYGAAGRVVREQGGGMALNPKLCHVLRATTPENKCCRSKLQYSCHGNYKMGNHCCHCLCCHMPYGEIMAPWVMEGDKKCWVHPKRLQVFWAG